MNTRPKPSAVIFAKDIELLARFYREVAEMNQVLMDQEHIVLNEHGFQLVVFGIPRMIADGIEITTPPKIRETAPIKICLPVTSIERARMKAPEFGGLVGPKTQEWDGPCFRACDGHYPEGNIFQLRESAA